MNLSDHPFDPQCRPVFSERAYKAADNYRCGNRELFYYLLHLGEHYDVLPLAYHFVKQALDDIDAQLPDEPGNDEIIDMRFKEPTAAFAYHSLQIDPRLFLRQFAAVLLTEPCWLENITQTATGATQIAVDLLGLHIRLTQTQPNAADRFRALLMQTDVHLPALCSWEFALHSSSADAMFNMAAMQLALAQFPRVFLPEILGFTLAYCRLSTEAQAWPNFSEKQETTAVTDFIALRQRLTEAQIPLVQQAISNYLQLFPELNDELTRRISTGLQLYRQLFNQCRQAFLQQMLIEQSPRRLLLNMLQQKAPFALGHHGKVQLQGRSLDSWFAETPIDGEQLLSALKQSAYINSEQPNASPLFKLFEPNGPMFGVFDDQERQLFENWLLAEHNAASSLISAQKSADLLGRESKIQNTESFSVIKSIALPIAEHGGEEILYDRLSNRELYYYLLNAELYPDVYATARRKAQTVLRTAKLLKRPPFEQYEHKRFENYLNTLYKREIEKYRPLQGKPKLSANTYRWGIAQFAPAILTDGCWLQHSIRLQYYAQRGIGKTLYRIFCDEVGYGRLEQNHPLIYRQLLESLDIRLPPLHSKAFIEHPGFINSAFDLPVYLMSIAAFPNAFLAELLGLNLAIELSGLGRLYMGLVDNLEYWSIDASIVKVHISADNFASGHAAMAKQSVQTYLDEIAACSGRQEMHRHWRRIHNGYTSLTTVSLRFFAALLCGYFRNYALGKQ